MSLYDGVFKNYLFLKVNSMQQGNKYLNHSVKKLLTLQLKRILFYYLHLIITKNMFLETNNKGV